MALSSWRAKKQASQGNVAGGRRYRHGPHLVVGLQQPLVVSDVLHLVQEPAVDLGELVQLVHRVASSEGRRQDKDPLVCWRLQLLGGKYSFTI